jgi:CHAT domain-containing protein
MSLQNSRIIRLPIFSILCHLLYERAFGSVSHKNSWDLLTIYGIEILIISIPVIGLLHAIRVSKLFKKKNIDNLIMDFYILLFVFTPLLVLLGLFNPASPVFLPILFFKLLIEVPIPFFSGMMKALFSGRFAEALFFSFVISLYLLPCIAIWYSLSYILRQKILGWYCTWQFSSTRLNRKATIISFWGIQLVHTVGFLTKACLFLSLTQLAINTSLGVLWLFYVWANNLYLGNLGIRSLLPFLLSISAMAFIGLNVSLLFLFAGSVVTSIFLSRVLKILSPILGNPFHLLLNRILFRLTWFSVKSLSAIIEFMSSLSFVGFIANPIRIKFIQLTLIHFLDNDLAPKSVGLKIFATKVAQDILETNTTTSLSDKDLFFVGKIASKLFHLGDIKNAELLCSILENKNSNDTASYQNDDLFETLYHYYSESHQFHRLQLLLNRYSPGYSVNRQSHDSNYPRSFAYSNRISRMLYLSAVMKHEFIMGKYCKSRAKYISQYLSWQYIFEILTDLPDIKKQNFDFIHSSFGVGTSIDLYKSFLLDLSLKVSSSTYKSKLIEDNHREFVILLATIQLMFERQDKAHLFLTLKDPTLCPNSKEIKDLLCEQFIVDILGMKVVVKNLFFKENKKLVPLIHLLANTSSSRTAISTLRQSAEQEGRRLELAFLTCCEGKLLVDNNILEEGISYLNAGIELYEGARHSISTDNLAIGFGSAYLEYCNWMISALVQTGDFSLAFEYTEKANSRALLDLVSGKTASNSGKDSNSKKLINKIREIDLHLYHLQSDSYEKSVFHEILPRFLKVALRNRFDNTNQYHQQKLFKERRSLLKQLERIDALASALIDLSALSLQPSGSSSPISTSFEALWNSKALSKNEVAIHIHAISKSDIFSSNRLWEKVVCFALFMHEGKLKLCHHIINDERIVHELQNSCKSLIHSIKRWSDPKQNKQRRQSQSVLTKHMLLPLLNQIPDSYKTLAISANQDFQFLPWGVLFDQDYEKTYDPLCKNLVEVFQTKITPSFNFLYLLKLREDKRCRKEKSESLFAGISEYLKPSEQLFWTSIEIDHSSGFYENSYILKDEEVDLLFEQKLKDAEIVHFSGHADRNESKPNLESLEKVYLCLYKKRISAAKILSGSLNCPQAKAILLSACLTGQGDLTISGSEVLGLERALFYAGASSLVTTLWSVDDFATAILMIKFHEIWSNQNNSLDSLSFSFNAAQCWLKELTYRELGKQVIDIEELIKTCLTFHQCLLTIAESENDTATKTHITQLCNRYENIQDELRKKSDEKCFSHPYYWAAFQVKGLG